MLSTCTAAAARGAFFTANAASDAAMYPCIDTAKSATMRLQQHAHASP
jgi:hypothetical protein